MKLGQTKWFKDIMTFTKRVNVEDDFDEKAKFK